ncbi:MAG TPA: cupin domain-containing protein [Hyphomicrobiales bacterium]|nr:cupin domain-containing protein [Hyphomicrobiales bacterium]
MSFDGCPSAVPTIQTDDEYIKITRWDFAPGAATGWHTHAWPYIVVMLTDAKMRLHDGKNITEADLKAGQAYKRPAGVTHDVMNGADAPMAFIEIEIKRPLS